MVTKAHNDTLMGLILMTEVEEALGKMAAAMTPVPNGFAKNFLHSFWNLVKGEVWEIVEDSRKTQHILPALKETFVSLIPKMGDAIYPYQFISIALCNVIYKIITKVIANLLKPILPCVSP